MQRKAAEQLAQGHQPPGGEETGRLEETAGQVRPGGPLQEQVRKAEQAVLRQQLWQIQRAHLMND